MRLQWAGEEIELHAGRAIYWPRRRSLIVADLHLGKPAAFRSGGLPVPDGSADADLARLDSIIARTRAKRLVILGDFLHAPAARSPATLAALAAWRKRRSRLDVLLIRGNHDDRAGDPPAEHGFRVADQPASDPDDSPLLFRHHPAPDPATDGFTLCGHIHPAIVAHDTRATGMSLRAPCFWFTKRAAVLPAFGSFTGAKSIRPARGDRVFAVGEDSVVEIKPFK